MFYFSYSCRISSNVILISNFFSIFDNVEFIWTRRWTCIFCMSNCLSIYTRTNMKYVSILSLMMFSTNCFDSIFSIRIEMKIRCLFLHRQDLILSSFQFILIFENCIQNMFNVKFQLKSTIKNDFSKKRFVSLMFDISNCAK